MLFPISFDLDVVMTNSLSDEVNDLELAEWSVLIVELRRRVDADIERTTMRTKHHCMCMVPKDLVQVRLPLPVRVSVEVEAASVRARPDGMRIVRQPHLVLLTVASSNLDLLHVLS